MTDIGKRFASIAETIMRVHGFGSNKMTTGYTVYEIDSYAVDERRRAEAELLDQLVTLGYLRKFTTDPHLNNKTRNYRYRFMVKSVCFGLTAKGWSVAEQYITAAYGAETYKSIADSWKGVTSWKTGDPVEAIDDWDEYVN